jgi:TetR/AcrR family transcriptional repressor of lmrAB and yxaGH operons
MRSARDEMIATTCELLESQGFHGTGLSQILKESKTPKGSLYYYFPEGKVELAEAAIRAAGQAVAARIAAALAGEASAGEAVRSFVLFIAEQVEASEFRSGGPLATVAMETATTNPRLNHACREAYTLLLQAFSAQLSARGFGSAQAESLALGIIAAIEGGTLLCRTFHSGTPLRQVADQLAHMLTAAQPA